MKSGIEQGLNIKNINYPFTELFSLLKRYDSSAELPVLAYTSKELKIINHHIENAMNILSQGMHGLGYCIGMVALKNEVSAEVSQLGFFISAISNLIEALNDLRSDSDAN